MKHKLTGLQLKEARSIFAKENQEKFKERVGEKEYKRIKKEASIKGVEARRKLSTDKGLLNTN